MDASLRRLEQRLGALQALPETERHVENIDRKTGPVLVPGGGPQE